MSDKQGPGGHASHHCSKAAGDSFLHTSPAQGEEALVQACLLVFFPKAEKNLYSHNKNKSVLYLTIYFKYFHYEA